MVYFNKMKSNLGGLSCTRGPPQPKDYTALAGLPQATVAPLQRVQNSAAHLIFKLSSREQLHCLPVRWCVQFKLCCIMHCVTCGMVQHIWPMSSSPLVPAVHVPVFVIHRWPTTRCRGCTLSFLNMHSLTQDHLHGTDCPKFWVPVEFWKQLKNSLSYCSP